MLEERDLRVCHEVPIFDRVAKTLHRGRVHRDGAMYQTAAQGEGTEQKSQKSHHQIIGY